MKKNITTKFVRLIVMMITVSFLFSSCEKWIDPDINVNPDAATDVSVELILPSIQVSLGYTFGGANFAAYGAIWTQHIRGADRQFVAINNYNMTNADVNNPWNNMYNGFLMDCQLMIQKAELAGKESPHFAGVGKILMAYSLGTATDVFGSLPYNDAFMGNDNILTPEYQTQEEIYTIVNNLLTEAIADLQQTENFVDLENDLIYGGNAAAWIRSAYSLRARYAMHLVELGGVNYTNVLADLGNGISNEAEGFAQPFADGATEHNPMSQFLDDRDGYLNDNTFFQDMLSNTNDPRGSVLTYDGYWAEANREVRFLDYGEVLFLTAEAQYRDGDEASAITALGEAVTASLQKYGVYDGAWYTSYETSVSGLTGAALLEEIMTQKYIHMMYNIESYTDYRRTGYPVLTPTQGSVVASSFVYPQDEVDYNPNTPSTTVFTKVWWDK